jgi:hypothetical protein
VLFALPANEALVAFRCFATKKMIDMYRGKRADLRIVAKHAKHTQKRHRVHAATHGNEQSILRSYAERS